MEKPIGSKENMKSVSSQVVYRGWNLSFVRVFDRMSDRVMEQAQQVCELVDTDPIMGQALEYGDHEPIEQMIRLGLYGIN